MKTRLAVRATALGLAAFFTFAMLGSVDFLATSQPSTGVLAATAGQPGA